MKQRSANWAFISIGSDDSDVIYGDTYGVKVPGSHAGYRVYSAKSTVKNLTANL